MNDPLVAFVRALQSAQAELPIEDAADILWLALQLGKAADPAQAPMPSPGPLQVQPESALPPRLPQSRDQPTTSAIPTPQPQPESAPVPQAQVPAALYQAGSRTPRATTGLPIRAPAAPALPGKRELLRALRPLFRRGASRLRHQIDLPATVQRVVDEGLWLPLLRPAQDRWFEVVVLIERSASMGMWQKLAAEFRLMLESSGAFASVRSLQLLSDPPIGLAPLHAPRRASQQPWPLSRLRDPRQRTLFLVLTDCVSAGWSNGRMAQFLAAIAELGPLALVQVFPEHLLDHTALAEAQSLWLHGIAACSANRTLQAMTQDDLQRLAIDARHYLKLPVLTLEPQSMSSWARMLSAAAGVWVGGYALPLPAAWSQPVDQRSEALEQPPDLPPAAVTSPTERVAAFRLSASPIARYLATLLTVFQDSGFSLPILRLVRQTLVPKGRPHHEAEVLLSGLLLTRPESAEHVLSDPERVLYDYAPGVAPLLAAMPQPLGAPPLPDRRGVLETITHFVAQQFGSSRDFMAVVSTIGGMAHGQSEFAQLSEQLLAIMGGQYAALAQGSSARLLQWSAASHPQRSRVDLAAYLGDQLAMALTQQAAPAGTTPLREWLSGLRRFGTLVLADVARFIAEYVRQRVGGLSGSVLEYMDTLLQCAKDCAASPTADRISAAVAAADSAEKESVGSVREVAALVLCIDATRATVMPWMEEQPHALRLQAVLLQLATAATDLIRDRPARLQAAISAHLREQLLDPNSYLLPAWRSNGTRILVAGDQGQLSEPLRQTAALLGSQLAAAGYELLLSGVTGVERVTLRHYLAQRERQGGAPVTLPTLEERELLARTSVQALNFLDAPAGEPASPQQAHATILMGESPFVQWLPRYLMAAGEPVLPLPWTGSEAQRAFKQLWKERDRYWAFDSRRLGFIDPWWAPDSSLQEQTRRVVHVLEVSFSPQAQAQYRRFSLNMLRLLLSAAADVEAFLATPFCRAYAASLAAAAHRPLLTPTQLAPAEYERAGQTESALLQRHLDELTQDATPASASETRARIVGELATLLPAMREWLAFDLAQLAELADRQAVIANDLVDWLAPLVVEHAWPLARAALLATQFRSPRRRSTLTTLLGVVNQAHRGDTEYRQEVFEIATIWAQMYLQVVTTELGEARLELIKDWLRDSGVATREAPIQSLLSDPSPARRMVGYLIVQHLEVAIPQDLATQCLAYESRLVESTGEQRPLSLLTSCLANQDLPAAVPAPAQQLAPQPELRKPQPSHTASARDHLAPDDPAAAAPAGHFTIVLGGLDLRDRVYFQEDKFNDLRDFFDTLYSTYLRHHFEPFTYGAKWILVNMETDQILAPWSWICAHDRTAITTSARGWMAANTPHEVGLVAGSMWRIMSSDLSAFGIAVDETVHYLLAMRDKRKFSTLLTKELLVPAEPEAADPEVYNYTAIFYAKDPIGPAVGGHRAYKSVRPAVAVSDGSWASGAHAVCTLIGHSGELWQATYSPDSRHIVTASEDRTARVWDAASGALLCDLGGHGAGVHGADYSGDGQRMVTWSADYTVRLVDAASYRLLAVLMGHQAEVNSAHFSPDGQRIVTASEDHSARLWDAGSGQLLCELRGHTAGVRRAEFSPDGRIILTASGDHTARLWDAENGKLLVMLTGHAAAVHCVRFSPDGRHIVTASEDHKVRLWNASDGRLRRELHGHDSPVYNAEFSPDGRFLVSAAWQGHIWHVEYGALIAKLRTEGAAILGARYSPDGAYIVTAGSDHRAWLWSAVNGRRLGPLSGHASSVVYATFSPDGRHVVTASKDGTARIWAAAKGAPVTG